MITIDHTTFKPNVTQIKDVTQDTMNSYGENPKFQFLRTSSIDSISNSNEEVNDRFFLSTENKSEQPFYGMPINEPHSDPELAVKKKNSLNTTGNNSSSPNSKLGSVRDSSASIVSIL